MESEELSPESKEILKKYGVAEPKLEELPERERWLFKNPEHLEAVLKGIDQAKKGQFAKNPFVIDLNNLEDDEEED